MRAEIDRIHKLGVNGVPFFIVAGKYGLSGAQPSEIIDQTLRQAASESESSENR